MSHTPEHEHHRGRVLTAAVTAALIGGVIGGAVMWLVLRTNGTNGQQPGMQAAMPPAQVRVGRVEQQALRERFDVVGRLQELRRATVAAEVSGRVLEVPIDAGDPVVGGETVLAQIDGVWARLALREAEARLAAAQANVDQSRRDYGYLQTLQERGSAKPREVEDAATTVASDEAALREAEAAMELAQQRVDRLRIVAPFDGAVIDRLVERGQWVNQGTPVAEVITTGSFDAEVFVPEQYIRLVAVGENVDVTVEPLKMNLAGRVVAVVPSAENAARTFPVKIRLDDPEGVLKAGMSVIAHLPISDAQPRLTVPRDAVLFAGGDATVWVATETAEGPRQALAVPVAVLFGVGDRYVVEPLGATLEPGAAVVVQGGERLIPNQPLMIDSPPAALASDGGAPDPG